MNASSVLLSTVIFAVAGLAQAPPPLQLSVYATAGGVERLLLTPEGRDKVLARLQRLRITGIVLEARRGDEYVSPEQMKPVRDFFLSHGFRVSGGIATVPGKQWGVRQVGPYGWLNYQSAQTQRDIAAYFRENAAVFDELIVDDFYCTEDTSPESEKARAGRDWGEYRRELLISLLGPMIFEPARQAKPAVKLIIKYPQWYDRFHLFGYEPQRMSVPFDRVWVGTEIRNPKTQRMGYLQPYEGFVNFSWIRDVAGGKVFGAWFDHIECTAQNFLDQAWQSALAGASELTLFNLFDVMEGHPGHALLEKSWPQIVEANAAARRAPAHGVPFYRPVNGPSEDNLWLMDYAGMLGIPVVPASRYPSASRVAMLGVQAAGDAALADKMRQHLRQGATLIVTPALLRQLGAASQQLAGVKVTANLQAETAATVQGRGISTQLARPLEVDAGLSIASAAPILWAKTIPLLTSRRVGGGTILVWNVRTFTEADYAKTGERLLPPAQLGLPELPQAVAGELRRHFTKPIEARLSGPAGVAHYLFGAKQCLYNFNDQEVAVELNGKPIRLPANGVYWSPER